MWNNGVNFIPLFFCPQLHHPADSTGEFQVRSVSELLCVWVCVHVFDVMSPKCNPHRGTTLNTSVAEWLTCCFAVPSIVCHASWCRAADLLIRVCLRRWCQSPLSQCFHNGCVCVCHACKTVLRSLCVVCLGLCASSLRLRWRLWSCVCGAPVSHAWS